MHLATTTGSSCYHTVQPRFTETCFSLHYVREEANSEERWYNERRKAHGSIEEKRMLRRGQVNWRDGWRKGVLGLFGGDHPEDFLFVFYGEMAGRYHSTRGRR